MKNRFISLFLAGLMYYRVEAFSQSPLWSSSQSSSSARTRSTRIYQFYTDSDPSDYDAGAISDGSKTLQVDTNEADVAIRDDLRSELILLSSVTNRGEYASLDEQNLIVDLVAQLEALNPTDNAADCQGEWDLALSSTQFFRTSPFFQTLRAVLGDQRTAENAFDLHDRATTASRIGRVRQTITSDKLISEVELEVGLVPGIPWRVKGTVVTTAGLSVVSPTEWELRVQETHVRGSNLPIINQFLDDPRFEVPVASLFQALGGIMGSSDSSVPVVPLKTFYLDDSMRITRDVDDNIFVFTRS